MSDCTVISLVEFCEDNVAFLYSSLSGTSNEVASVNMFVGRKNE